MKGKHTEGEWVINKPNFETIEICCSEGNVICSQQYSMDDEVAEVEINANFQLIKNAHKMLSFIERRIADLESKQFKSASEHFELKEAKQIINEISK